jgi:hypothetical protein
MAGLNVEIAPKCEPVDLATMKNHLRVTVNNDDALIGGLYLPAARELVEDFTALSLINKGYRQSMDSFPHHHGIFGIGLTSWEIPERMGQAHRLNHHHRIKLLRSPLVHVTKITYIGTDQAFHDLLPEPRPWQAETEFVVGDQIGDSNGNLQQVTAVSEEDPDGTSESGATVPTWPAADAPVGTTTADGDLTWTKEGVAPAGDFQYNADDRPPSVYPSYGTTWPETLRVENAVQIHFVSGHGDDATAVPNRAKLAIMVTTGNWYVNRESVTSETMKALPNHLEDLLWGIRVLDFNPTPG